jgi:hypothetical protein
MDDHNYDNEGMPSEVLSPEEQAQVDESERLEVERARTREPSPAVFDDYDNYVRSLADFKTKKALAEFERDRASKAASYRLDPNNPNLDVGFAIEEGVRQGLTDVLGPPLTPLQQFNAQVAAQSPDDELLPARQEAIDWIEECRHGKILVTMTEL